MSTASKTKRITTPLPKPPSPRAAATAPGALKSMTMLTANLPRPSPYVTPGIPHRARRHLPDELLVAIALRAALDIHGLAPDDFDVTSRAVPNPNVRIAVWWGVRQHHQRNGTEAPGWIWLGLAFQGHTFHRTTVQYGVESYESALAVKPDVLDVASRVLDALDAGEDHWRSYSEASAQDLTTLIDGVQALLSFDVPNVADQ